MVAERLLLCEDAQPELNRLVQTASTRGVPAPAERRASPPQKTFPHDARCEHAGTTAITIK